MTPGFIEQKVASHGSVLSSQHYRQPPGSTPVGHCSGRYRCFDGLVVATRRRRFRRNPDNTVNLNMPSITLDIGNVGLDYANEGARPDHSQHRRRAPVAATHRASASPL
jgi:hypothetical protein